MTIPKLVPPTEEQEAALAEVVKRHTAAAIEAITQEVGMPEEVKAGIHRSVSFYFFCLALNNAVQAKVEPKFLLAIWTEQYAKARLNGS